MTNHETRSPSRNGATAGRPPDEPSPGGPDHPEQVARDLAVMQVLGRVVDLLEQWRPADAHPPEVGSPRPATTDRNAVPAGQRPSTMVPRHPIGAADGGTGVEPLASVVDRTAADEAITGDETIAAGEATAWVPSVAHHDGASQTPTAVVTAAGDDCGAADSGTDLEEPAGNDAEGAARSPGVSSRPRFRRLQLRRPRPAVAAVAAVMVLLAAATAWLGSDRVSSGDLASARAQATSAARVVATEMATYSYQSLNKEFAAVERHSTPSFAATFKKQSSSLVSTLQKYKATSSGTVRVAGVVQASASSAQVLVIVDQTIHNTAISTPSPQVNGLLLTMVHRDGHWLLERVAVE